MYLVVTDGTAAETMITTLHPWIHCVVHVGSLIIKDTTKIREIADLLDWMTNAQHWFGTNRLKALLQKFCKEHYGCIRSFIFPADTRFAGKLLQIKHFSEMKSALQQCVMSSQYMRFNFENDTFAERITEGAVWRLILGPPVL